MASLFEAMDLSENAQAMDAIREVEPGAHFLGSAHTRSDFLTAFHESTVSDNDSYEQWSAEGGLDGGPAREHTVEARLLET